MMKTSDADMAAEIIAPQVADSFQMTALPLDLHSVKIRKQWRKLISCLDIKLAITHKTHKVW